MPQHVLEIIFVPKFTTKEGGTHGEKPIRTFKASEEKAELHSQHLIARSLKQNQMI
jgi:hypothetical protein